MRSLVAPSLAAGSRGGCAAEAVSYVQCTYLHSCTACILWGRPRNSSTWPASFFERLEPEARPTPKQLE